MTKLKWKKIVARRARDVLATATLSDESHLLLDDEITPEAFIEALQSEGQLFDAANSMAHLLPRREAVWWACMCARQMQTVIDEKSEQLALSAAEKWVYEPTDERRAVAFQAAQDSKTDSGGVLCALAAAFSGAALPVASEQTLDVDVNKFPGLVFAVIGLAATEGDVSMVNERLQKLLTIGKEIADGGSGKLNEGQKT